MLLAVAGCLRFSEVTNDVEESEKVSSWLKEDLNDDNDRLHMWCKCSICFVFIVSHKVFLESAGPNSVIGLWATTQPV